MKTLERGELETFAGRYDYLAGITREGWAWEHVRRDRRFAATAYRAQDDLLVRPSCHDHITLYNISAPQPGAEAWGLVFFPNPDKNAIDADLFWSPHLFPRKVEVHVTNRMPGEVDEIYDETVRACRIKHLTDWEGAEHLRIRGLNCSIQVRCHGRSLLSKDPVRMAFDIRGVTDIEEKFRILKKARAIYGDDSDRPPAFSAEAQRLRDGVIALDARMAGLSLAETAEILFGAERVREEWSNGGRWMKDRVRSHIDRATRIMQGGYRAMLRRQA